MKLLPSQKKKVFEVIEQYDASLLPRFYWGQRPSTASGVMVEALFVRETEFFFAFESNSGNSFFGIVSPGASRYFDQTIGFGWGAFPQIFIGWLDTLVREINGGDPWGDLAKAVSQSHIQIDKSTQATKLTFSEYSQVEQTLDVIKGLLITFAKADSETLTRIDKEISSLKEAAKEQDRKSVFYQVVGFIASSTVSMLLAPEQTRALYEALKSGFGKFLLLTGN